MYALDLVSRLVAGIGRLAPSEISHLHRAQAMVVLTIVVFQISAESGNYPHAWLLSIDGEVQFGSLSDRSLGARSKPIQSRYKADRRICEIRCLPTQTLIDIRV